MLGSPGSPAQPVALPHCVCEWERGTPNAPRTPIPHEPFRGQARRDEAGPGPSPMRTLLGFSRSPQTSRASDMTEGRGVLRAEPKGYPDPTREADLLAR